MRQRRQTLALQRAFSASASNRARRASASTVAGDFVDDLKAAATTTMSDIKHAVIADALGVVLGVLLTTWATGD